MWRNYLHCLNFQSVWFLQLLCCGESGLTSAARSEHECDIRVKRARKELSKLWVIRSISATPSHMSRVSQPGLVEASLQKWISRGQCSHIKRSWTCSTKAALEPRTEELTITGNGNNANTFHIQHTGVIIDSFCAVNNDCPLPLSLWLWRACTPEYFKPLPTSVTYIHSQLCLGSKNAF